MMRWLLAALGLMLVFPGTAEAQPQSPYARAYYQQQMSINNNLAARRRTLVEGERSNQRLRQQQNLLWHRNTQARRTKPPGKDTAVVRPARIQRALVKKSADRKARRATLTPRMPRFGTTSRASKNKKPFARLFRGNRSRSFLGRTFASRQAPRVNEESVAPRPTSMSISGDGDRVVVKFQGKERRLPKGDEVGALRRLMEKRGMSKRKARRAARRAVRKARRGASSEIALAN
jgi:hypothetical protein